MPFIIEKYKAPKSDFIIQPSPAKAIRTAESFKQETAKVIGVPIEKMPFDLKSIESAIDNKIAGMTAPKLTPKSVSAEITRVQTPALKEIPTVPSEQVPILTEMPIGKEPSGVVANIGEIRQPEPHGIAKELAYTLPAGVISTGENLMRAFETISKPIGVNDWFREAADQAQESYKKYKPTREGVIGAVRGGAESTIQSLSLGVPGAIVAPLITGGALGAAIGFALGAGGMFTAAEYSGFMNDVKQSMKSTGATDDEIKKAQSELKLEGIISAASEGGFEAVSDLFMMKVLGLIGSKTLKEPAKRGLSYAMRKAVGTYAKLAAAEVPTEMATAAIETAMRRKAGIEGLPTPTEAAINVIPQVLVQTGLMGLGGYGVSKFSKPPSTDAGRTAIGQVPIPTPITPQEEISGKKILTPEEVNLPPTVDVTLQKPFIIEKATTVSPTVEIVPPVPPKVTGEQFKGKAWRADTGYTHGRNQTAKDVLDFEAEELGNDTRDQALKLGIDYGKYKASDLIWVTAKEKDAMPYGMVGDKITNPPSEWDITSNNIIVAEDGADGYLVLNNYKGVTEKPEVPIIKQPWEMTRDEYDREEKAGNIAWRNELAPEDHKTFIIDALSEGKPVPLEVLSDYPDLVKKYGKEVKPQEQNIIDTIKHRGKKANVVKLPNGTMRLESVSKGTNKFSLPYSQGEYQTYLNRKEGGKRALSKQQDRVIDLNKFGEFGGYPILSILHGAGGLNHLTKKPVGELTDAFSGIHVGKSKVGAKPFVDIKKNYIGNDAVVQSVNELLGNYNDSMATQGREVDIGQIFEMGRQELEAYEQGLPSPFSDKLSYSKYNKYMERKNNQDQLRKHGNEIIDDLRKDGATEEEIKQIEESDYELDTINRINEEVTRRRIQTGLRDADEEILRTEGTELDQEALDALFNYGANVEKPVEQITRKIPADETTSLFELNDSVTKEIIPAGTPHYVLHKTGEIVSADRYNKMTQLARQEGLFGEGEVKKTPVVPKAKQPEKLYYYSNWKGKHGWAADGKSFRKLFDLPKDEPIGRSVHEGKKPPEGYEKLRGFDNKTQELADNPVILRKGEAQPTGEDKQTNIISDIERTTDMFEQNPVVAEKTITPESINNINKYISYIKNPEKKKYAADYRDFVTGTITKEPMPKPDTLGMMAQQAVRKSINDIIKIQKPPTVTAGIGGEIIPPELPEGKTNLIDDKGSIRLPKIGLIPSSNKFQFDNSDTQKEFDDAHGIKKEPFLKTSLDSINNYGKLISRTYEFLPKTKEFAQLQFDLLRLQKQKQVTSEKVGRIISAVIEDMDENEFYNFGVKVLLDDFNETIQKNPETELPFELNKDNVPIELTKINDMVKDNPRIQEAFVKRKKVWDYIRSVYPEAMESIGYNTEGMFNREDYFRHQVLDHVIIKSMIGTGKKLRTPTGRSFAKKRMGSKLAINTDYVQAENEVLAQMIYDIQVAKTLKSIIDKNDIVPELKAQAKKEGIDDWHDLITDEYSIWQPREGNVFYLTETIPARIAKQLATNTLETIGITSDDLNKVLAVGGKRREIVVKNEIAVTLDNLVPIRSNNIIVQFDREVIRKWKQWQLVSPRRLGKYNIRNLTGDADHVFLGNKMIFTKVPRAMKDLWKFYSTNTMPTGDLSEWFDRGGSISLLQAQEMDKIGGLHSYIKKYEIDRMGILPRMWYKYWRAARLTTDFREAILRYAAYIYAKEDLMKHNGKSSDYWASKPEEIDGLKTTEDKAFWLSNDLLGAYDRIGRMGINLREHWFPFWSWQEVNFRIYYQTFKNAANNNQLAEKVGRKLVGSSIRSTFTLIKIGKWMIKASAFFAILQAWNHFVMKDLEKSLPKYIKDRPHMVLGGTKDDVYYFDRIGALSDLLEWGNLDSSPRMINDWFKGKVGIKDVALEIAKAPINKFVSGSIPLSKLALETLMRRSTYPDAFRARPIRDRMQYIAQSIGIKDEYDAIANKPSRGYIKSLAGLAVYHIDLDEAAYNDVIGGVAKYKMKIGKGGEGFWMSEKSNSLYNVRLALKYKDNDAAEKYKEKYYKQGGTDEGFERSLESMNPFYGLIPSIDKLRNPDAETMIRLTQLDECVKYINDNNKIARALKFYVDLVSLRENDPMDKKNKQ